MPRPTIPDRRETLLDVAERLVLDRGFDAMSVQSVADAAGRGVLPESIELRGGTDRVVTVADPAAHELGVEFPERSEPSGEELAELVDLVVRGEVQVPVAEVLPLGEAARGQGLVDAGRSGGKVVLVP